MPVHQLRPVESAHEGYLNGRFDVQLTSETARLGQVIVHTPGEEVALVSPENRQDLLFEDILFVGNARKEHLLMAAVFEKIVGRSDSVIQIGGLLRDAFIQESARHFFVDRLCRDSPESNLHAFEGDLHRLYTGSH